MYGRFMVFLVLMFLSAVSVGCNGSDTVDRTQLFGIWQTEEDGSSTIVTFQRATLPEPGNSRMVVFISR
jgi:hypothetical protein